MGIPELLAPKRAEILAVAQRHGVGQVRVFGSVARGEATVDSDVDFLVDVTGTTTPWFPAGLVQDLQDLLGRRVEVVTPNALHWLLRPRILKEAVPL